MIIDDTLSWSPQVSSICQRIYYSLHRLYKFRTFTPISTRIRLVNSLVLPLIDYCLFVCCNMNQECIDRLQVAMNNSIRYIYNVKPREHITPYYVKLGWLKVKERRALNVCVMTHKILHGYAPEYLNDIFTKMGNVRLRQGNRSHNLYLQAPHIGVSNVSFTVKAYREWNNLQPDFYDIKMTKSFKRKVEAKLLCSY